MAIDIYQIISENLFSIIILIFGAMFLYFGKIIQDIQVEEGDKIQIYLNGLIFSSVHVLLPLAIAFMITFSLKPYNESLITYLVYIQIGILLGTLFFSKRYYDMRHRGESIKRTRNEVKILYAIPMLIVSFTNWMLTLYCYQIFQQNQIGLNFLNFLLSMITITFTFTLLAGIFSYHTVYYPTVTIHAGRTPFSNVKLIKSGKTVQISRGGQTILINKDKINYIEILD